MRRHQSPVARAGKGKPYAEYVSRQRRPQSRHTQPLVLKQFAHARLLHETHGLEEEAHAVDAHYPQQLLVMEEGRYRRCEGKGQNGRHKPYGGVVDEGRRIVYRLRLQLVDDAVRYAAVRQVDYHGAEYGYHGQQSEVGGRKQARKYYVAHKGYAALAYALGHAPFVYFSSRHI